MLIGMLVKSPSSTVTSILRLNPSGLFMLRIERGDGVSVCKCNWILPERISLLLVEIGYLIQHSRVDSGIGIPSDS